MSEAQRKYDLYSQDFKRNAYKTFETMRRDDPIYRQLGLDGRTPIWFITRYEDVEAMLRDKRFVRDESSALPPEKRLSPNQLDLLLNNHMLTKEGIDHLRLRHLVSKAFTPKRIAALRPRIEAIACTLIDQVQTKGSMDLIAEFSFPLPRIVILEMLGVPTEDREKFKVWSNALLEPQMDAAGLAQAIQHLTDFTNYLRDLFARRRAEPKDDLMTALVQAEEAGDKLSESELFSTMVLLIVAGHETTVNLIANAVLALFRNPEQFAKLKANPHLMPSAVEEFLRYDGSVERALSRWAAEDVDWKGHHISRGDAVMLVLGSANHDAEKFANPENLELQRDPNPHLGFGKGAHYCLGAPLARLETEVAMNALLSRLPNLRLALDESELRWRFLPGFRGLEALPVSWEKQQSEFSRKPILATEF
jgi:cytochrome P450